MKGNRDRKLTVLIFHASFDCWDLSFRQEKRLFILNYHPLRKMNKFFLRNRCAKGFVGFCFPLVVYGGISCIFLHIVFVIFWGLINADQTFSYQVVLSAIVKSCLPIAILNWLYNSFCQMHERFFSTTDRAQEKGSEENQK